MNKIGPYEIRDLLGEGGIGRVYAAFDTVLEREVAIKSLRPELLHDKSFIERFRSEATSLARLNHNHALLAAARSRRTLHGHRVRARHYVG
jgi:eukaryotic-like serine/threonine-protein kinase